MNYSEVEIPADPMAERLVLGSIFRNGGAEGFSRVSELLSESSFTQHKHKLLFSAMRNVFESGKEINVGTIFLDFKSRPGELAIVGSITEWLDGIPGLANLENFCEVVAEKERLRKIQVAAESIQQRVLERAPSQDILAEAQELLLGSQMGNRRKKALRPTEIIDRAGGIEALINPNAGSAIKTPWSRINNATNGLRPGQLWILGGLPGTGKTSFATQLIDFAVSNRPDGSRGFRVKMASREMISDQILVNMACTRGKVDSQEIQSESCSREARERFMEALVYYTDQVDDLLEIDDEECSTVPALAAALRKNVAENRPVQLVVVDFLQLLEGVGKIDSRRHAIDQIAYGLKGVAKSFRIPVLALAQLNTRKPETEGGGAPRDNVKPKPIQPPSIGDFRECVVGSTLVNNATTGGLTAVRDLQPGSYVMAMDDQQRIRPFEVADVWSTGVKQAFCVKTDSGRQLCCTANHPLFTDHGWRRLENLQCGDYIASAWGMPDHYCASGDLDLCRLLGYMVGDGTCRNHSAIGFISNDPEVFDDFSRIVSQRWPEVTVRLKWHPEGYLEGEFSRIYENGYGKPGGNPLREWLRSVGLLGKRDCQKFVPSFVFDRGNAGIAEFLAGYLATDGCVTRRIDRGVERWAARFDTVSRRLADDVQSLLQRLGIASRISPGRFSKKAKRPIYRITVCESGENVGLFAKVVPVVGVKKSRLLEAAECMSQKTSTNPGAFGLPPIVSHLLSTLDSKWRDQGKRLGRGTALAAAAEIDDKTLRQFAQSDLLWERITSIEAVGEHEVFDLCVPGANCFVANGLIAHNSGAIEQSADVAIILRLADVEQQFHVVQLIDAFLLKQRGGKRGKIPFRFISTYRTFEEIPMPQRDGEHRGI